MFRQRPVLAAALSLVFLLTLTRFAAAEEVKGKIARVSAEKGQVVVTENFKDWTFLVDRDCQVSLNGRACKLAELLPGDATRITFTRQGERLLAAVACMRK